MLNSDTAGELVTGEFTLRGEHIVFGSLHINGDESKLILFDDKPFSPDSNNYDYIEGELHDGRLVSLIQCVNLGSSTRFSSYGKRKHSCTVFPHYTVVGSTYIEPSTHCIEKISFAIEDAPAIFHASEAFSTVPDSKYIAAVIEQALPDSQSVKFENNPTIAYFTGQFNIATINTVLGKVGAENRPSMNPGGAKGIQIDNTVFITLQLPAPTVFQDAVSKLQTLLRFFNLIAGRHQPLIGLMLTITGQERPTVNVNRNLEVVSNNKFENSFSIRPECALLSTHRDADELDTTLRAYLQNDTERHDGRIRFDNAFTNHNHYTIDRLVSAANIFDILPRSVYPDKLELPPELEEAKNRAKSLFKNLPPSLEKDSTLTFLGRLGQLSLKHKIINRVSSTKLISHFPQLEEVLKEAVNCRNHYVHGSSGRVDYSNNIQLVQFFTDALEFSFAASDLIDCGWNFQEWKNQQLLHKHPFGHFVKTYQDRLKIFRETMKK